MAPPTGPRRGGSAQKTALRPTRGGGISKHRPAPKTDIDGDIAMGGPPADTSKRGSGSSGRGARAGRGGRATSRMAQNIRNYATELAVGSNGAKTQPNKTVIKILGLKNSKAASNPDGGLRSLLDFLERKSKEKITLGRGIIDGDYVWLKVNKDDAQHLLRLNGFTYAGATLTIEETNEPMPALSSQSKLSQAAQETKQKLTSCLARRYNAEQKLLDLSALGTDETLSSLGSFNNQSLAEKSFKALMHLVSNEYKDPEQKNEAIQAVSLARNDILDVGQVYSLAVTLPRLRRLDLSGNNLENLSKISKWQQEFRFLEELHLTGNPVTTLPNYATEIKKWFPSLQILDGQQIRTPQEAAESLKSSFPTPLPQLPSNVRDGENNVASTFLQAFFQLWDHDRLTLIPQFYDSETTFSVVFATDSPQDPASSSCSKFSRNLNILSPRHPSTLQRLFVGSNLIADLWKVLPATRHPSLDQTSQWLIDCHTFPHLADPTGMAPYAMGLMINVNGQCEEADISQNLYGTRTFSRCFILGPSKPGAPHPYRVLSDQLTLHTWKPQPAPQVGTVPPPAVAAPMPGAVPIPTATPAVAPVPPVMGDEPDDATKAQLIAEVSRRTGMNVEYSQMCLTGAANWNLELALQSFEQQKANVPPEAFISQPQV